MLRISLTSIVLQSSIDAVGENEVDRGDGSGNEKNLLNSSLSKKFIGARYLTSEGTKKDGGNPNNSGGNTQKGVQAARDSN